MQRQGYLKNAAVMTATGLILRAVGMVFRVYLAGSLGAQGMGVYQLISAVYALAVTLATAGLSMTAARICTDLLAAQQEKCLRSAMRRMLGTGCLAGIGTGLLLLAGAQMVSQLWLHEPRAVQSLQIAALSLPFMAASACLRGYFLARQNVMPDSAAQLLEQAVRIVVVMGLLYVLSPADLSAACALISLGGVMSELAHWVVLVCSYRKEQRNKKCCALPKGFSAQFAAIWAPIAANQCVSSLLHAVENVMVPACLTVYFMNREAALEQYGALKGMAMPVLFFPFSLLGALSTLLVPEIARAYVQRRKKVLQQLVQRVLLLTLVLSILAGGLFTVLAYDIGNVLYQSREIGFYVRVLGPLMPFLYLESMVDGMLKGMNEQLSTFRYTMLDTAVRIVLIAVLAPRLGMAGFLFVMLVSNLLTCCLNFRRLLSVSGVRIQWRRWVLKPLACCVAMGVLHRFVLMPYFADTMPYPIWLLVCAGCMTLLYSTLLLLTGCVSWHDVALRIKQGTASE